MESKDGHSESTAAEALELAHECLQLPADAGAEDLESGLELVAALVVELSVVVWVVTALYVRRIRGRFHPFALTVAQMGAGAVALPGRPGLPGRGFPSR